MVVDTSAIIAIARREPEALAFSTLLEQTPGKLMAVPTYLECVFVLAGIAPNKGLSFLQGLVADTLIKLVPFGEQELEAAVDARIRYSRGSGHTAKLNFGDCFAYALAKTRNVPLLFKGDDFIHTDIEPALKPA
ncbi:type II toxin-antitoxin system VapC family toxin [Aminobacter anthyllidis]|uniref:type II toxin-antitoxin system VapC family toxin n=1 Tax=Aminobacter anthyllidis TaxID=1035067 RepID=UPI002457B63E|nr:type II toxin-antitoxin system VapC family toxin [Aminobacter anthyllidis]MDH4986494.1 type II toxin-antitoxin system VapC family toxin [Aminobacter anthyllidis]